MRIVDLRSDTVTKPNEIMRKAMYQAEVGDDVFGEDPTVARLEALAAETFGKEAALLVPSGTMGNQIAVLTHTRRGDEIIVEAEAHIFYYEVGGLGALAGVQARGLKGNKGALDPDEVKKAIRSEDLHFPRTSLICMENTHNRAGGAVIPKHALEAVCKIAKDRGIAVHLDGARVFNAAVALGISVKELTREVDTVMFALSKGLGAPIGSMIVGTKEWITRARKWRKMLGGGMRQAGIIAAAGIVGLSEMVERLAEDHRLARRLGEGLAQIKGIGVNLDAVQTNMVVMDIKNTGLSIEQFLAGLKEHGTLATPFGDGLVRMVTHLDVDEDHIESALQAVNKVV